MTDIYVGSQRPRWVWILGILLLFLGLVIWFLQKDASSTEPTPVPPAPTATAQPEIVEEIEPPPPTATPAPFQGTPTAELPSLEEIHSHVKEEMLHLARKKAFERWEGLPEGADRSAEESILGRLHTRMVFEKIPMKEKITHVVESGDTLGKLAQKYGTTKELIAISNGIEGNLIRLGESLRILQGSFSAVVDKTENDMVVSLNGRFFKRYDVGTGTHSSTPEGDYKITLRLIHPVWYRPDGQSFPYGDPENLLGTHYLKLNTPGIGLHGTWEPETVGSQSSAGCVRLKNEMIEELYNLLPEGTSVRIENGY